jgi:hypothetical protein
MGNSQLSTTGYQRDEEGFTDQMVHHGPEVKKFEDKVSSYLHIKYAVAVNNGSSALDVAIKCLNVKKSDEVIIPAYILPVRAPFFSYMNYIFLMPFCRCNHRRRINRRWDVAGLDYLFFNLFSVHIFLFTSPKTDIISHVNI